MFTGFPKQTFTFLKDLDRNNNKIWFDTHRKEYEDFYMEPARQFVGALGSELMKIEPAVKYEAKVNKSIFRINRDIRFSKDKTPYKNHIDLWFWLGERKGWDAGGFFIGITPDKLILGAGIHSLEKDLLGKFRKSVIEAKLGRDLPAILEKLRTHKYEIGGASRIAVPKGYDAGHELSHLLLHEGLIVVNEEIHPSEISSSKFVPYCIAHFKKMAPLNAWLQKLIRQ